MRVAREPIRSRGRRSWSMAAARWSARAPRSCVHGRLATLRDVVRHYSELDVDRVHSYGDALLRPGLLRRRDALGRAARRAVELVGGAAPVLVIAGVIEGLVSPSELPAAVKFVIGPVLGVVLWVLLLRVGRPSPWTSPRGRGN